MKRMRFAISVLVMVLAALGAAQNLPRGTEIRLVLLKDLNSGGSVLGEEVPFMVAHDIVVGDRVIIPEGTLVAAEVKQVQIGRAHV